ncbi:MAG: hypothetical protein WDO24_06425 [Pseudomonadota bacterium]
MGERVSAASTVRAGAAAIVELEAVQNVLDGEIGLAGGHDLARRTPLPPWISLNS